jgi:hypothetical protein
LYAVLGVLLDEAWVLPFTAELRAVLETQKAKADALRREKAILSPFVFFWHQA